MRLPRIRLPLPLRKFRNVSKERVEKLAECFQFPMHHLKMKTKALVTLIAGLWTAKVLAGPAQTTFTKVTTGDIVNDVGIYMFCAWGDFNNDGFLDLFFSNYKDSTNALYLNNGNGTFTRVTQGAPVQEADYHRGVAAADYDNDGHLDLVTSSGTAAPTARPTRLCHNEAGSFRPVSGDGFTNQLGYFWACAWADYDSNHCSLSARCLHRARSSTAC